MEWVIGSIVAGVTGVAVFRAVRNSRPRVPPEQVAEEDQDLVRESDRAGWRRLRLSRYRADKRHDDFYRVAAYRREVARGASEADARARVRRDFPFYYLDPADRDAEGFAGEDGSLPVVLRERVTRNARTLKPLMESEGERFSTMNALIRVCLRKGAL
jgi:hypothetical protein